MIVEKPFRSKASKTSVNVLFAPSRTSFSLFVMKWLCPSVDFYERIVRTVPKHSYAVNSRLKRVEAKRVMVSSLSFGTFLGVVSALCTFALFVKKAVILIVCRWVSLISIDF